MASINLQSYRDLDNLYLSLLTDAKVSPKYPFQD